MLFKASITKEILADEEKLCEQLYVFLKEYVRTRLKYESSMEREDCIQETILFMLYRYHQLTKEELETVNLEKFFYNRARSFVSSYLNKLRIRHDKEKLLLNKKVPSDFPGNRSFEYEYLDFVEDGSSNQEEFDYIDYKLLQEIVDKFGLTNQKAMLLVQVSAKALIKLGYKGSVGLTSAPVIDESDNIIITLSYAVVDEYLLVNVIERREQL